jgi:serine/threonine protein kinase
MSPSPAGSPPELKGYTFRRLLGSGGFADVFLYEQDRTRRDVAVKVLREHVAGPERAQITAEAEVMAQLSTHPYIVSVFDTDIAADGRPYLVMEYYPRYNLAHRVRAGGLDVPEVLRLGVQLGSAVETAHRAGIVHRDIKPANILTSDYGRPGLTDFGIASSTGRTDAHEGHLSIPWAPPEAFAEKADLDSRADIYSLGCSQGGPPSRSWTARTASCCSSPESSPCRFR